MREERVKGDRAFRAKRRKNSRNRSHDLGGRLLNQDGPSVTRLAVLAGHRPAQFFLATKVMVSDVFFL